MHSLSTQPERLPASPFTSSTPDLPRLFGEVRALTGFYGADRAVVERCLGTIGPFLSDYAELVLGERCFDLHTGATGHAHALAAIGVRHGLQPVVGAAFLTCNAVFPARPCGLKLSFGTDAPTPTLYVRVRASARDTLAFLGAVRELAPYAPLVEHALGRRAAIFGLGFHGTPSGRLGLKVYAVDDLGAARAGARGIAGTSRGMLALRVGEHDGAVEFKRYVPRVPSGNITRSSRWTPIVLVARERLGVDRFDVGTIERADGRRELKLHVPRIEATDLD